MRGVSDLARLTPAAVEEKYGVPPHRYPELAAIVGETSDNLPGVPGVGQGYAAKWINQFDGLDNVIARADEITGKKGEALREHLGDVIRNRQLNALVRDLTLPLRGRASSAAAPGTVRPGSSCSTSSSSAASCAPACSTRSTRPRPTRWRPSRASSSTAAGWRPARPRPGWSSTPRRGAGRRRGVGHLARGHR